MKKEMYDFDPSLVKHFQITYLSIYRGILQEITGELARYIHNPSIEYFEDDKAGALQYL